MKTRSSRRRPPAAFTLIELLTVIAIIGILAAIIIPVTGKVRSSARNAQCVAKLRDWGRGIMLYANDNKGRYQCENWLSAASNPYLSYLPAIRDAGGVLRVEAFSYCPVVSDSKYSDSTFTRRSTYAMIIPSVEGSITNYINTEPYKTRNTINVGGINIVGAPLSRAARPSQYLMMCDSMGGSSSAFNANTTTVLVDPMFGLATPADDRGGADVANRHGRTKINGVFGDGSVKSISGAPAGSGDKRSIYEMRNTWFQLY